jgi:hypothetical protein
MQKWSSYINDYTDACMNFISLTEADSTAIISMVLLDSSIHIILLKERLILVIIVLGEKIEAAMIMQGGVRPNIRTVKGPVILL